MSRLESEPRRFVIKKEAAKEIAAEVFSSPEMHNQPIGPISHPATYPVSYPGSYPVSYPIEKKAEVLAEFDRDAEAGLLPLGVMLHNARILMASKEYRLAMHLLIDVLRRNSNHEVAIRDLGECYYNLKEWEKAERILKIAVEVSPQTSTLLLYADVLYGLGKNAEALRIYNELLLDISEDEDELFRAYKAMGNIHVRQGDLDSAEENYNRAFAIKSDSDVLLVNYGTLEIQRGNIQAALERYREALTIDDKNEKAWIGLALIHREYGDFELAWGNLHKALDLDASNSTAIQLMADWGVKDHKVSDAISRLESYLALNDQDSEKSLLLAKLFYISGRGDLAHIEATRAISIDPMIAGGGEFLNLFKAPTVQES